MFIPIDECGSQLWFKDPLSAVWDGSMYWKLVAVECLVLNRTSVILHYPPASSEHCRKEGE